jgi:hypothetical protein
MIYKKLILFAYLMLLASLFAHAQTTPKVTPSKSIVNAHKSSPAYAELLLRKTERESELEEFLLDYTEEFPKVKELRFELDLLSKEMDKILAVNVSEAGKLTLALGKLIVRKTELEVDVWNLKRQYSDDHQEVKRAKRKLETFEKAIKEIL